MNEKVDRSVKCRYHSMVANRWLTIRLEFIGNCVAFFAALFAVMSKEWGWGISAGVAGLSISYALNITDILSVAVRQISDLETNIVSVERVKEYSDSPTEAEWVVEGVTMPKGWPSTGEVVFDNYSTRYRPGLELVVHGLNISVKPGEKIGIVGRTGAGKSSMALALFRMIEPVEGRILVDGIDISRIGLHDLRGNLTIIPQDPVLFSGSLRFNLDPLNHHSDDEIWRALELAHLRDHVSNYTDGLTHRVDEGGDNMSVGQRQLVCLARAALRSSRVLVLDEATAAVDVATDALIQQTIRTRFAHCTVLTIAHRLHTILDYDRVLVLDQGRVREFDSPQALLARSDSMFAAMLADAANHD